MFDPFAVPFLVVVMFVSQALVATRNHYKIVHHHTIMQQHGQLVVATRAQSSHPGPAPANRRSATNTNTNTNTCMRTPIGAYSLGAPSRRTPLLPTPPLPRAAAVPNAPSVVSSTFSVVIDGNEPAFSNREVEGRWSPLGLLLAFRVGGRGYWRAVFGRS